MASNLEVIFLKSENKIFELLQETDGLFDSAEMPNFYMRNEGVWEPLKKGGAFAPFEGAFEKRRFALACAKPLYWWRDRVSPDAYQSIIDSPEWNPGQLPAFVAANLEPYHFK